MCLVFPSAVSMFLLKHWKTLEEWCRIPVTQRVVERRLFLCLERFNGFSSINRFFCYLPGLREIRKSIIVIGLCWYIPVKNPYYFFSVDPVRLFVQSLAPWTFVAMGFIWFPGRFNKEEVGNHFYGHGDFFANLFVLLTIRLITWKFPPTIWSETKCYRTLFSPRMT